MKIAPVKLAAPASPRVATLATKTPMKADNVGGLSRLFKGK